MSALLSYPHHIHFCNVNGIRSKFNNITAVLPLFPSSSLLAFVEAKIADCPPNTTKNHKGRKDFAVHTTPNLGGFVSYSHPFYRAASASATDKPSSGIVCYSHPNLQYRALPRLSFSDEKGTMMVFAETCINGLSFYFGVVYIHPSASSSDFTLILSSLERACSSFGSSPVLLLGDFNCRHAQFGDHISRSSANSNKLVAFFQSHFLSVLNTVNHAGVGTRGDSVLDLAVTTHPHLFSMDIDIFPLHSDHNTISIHVHGPNDVHPSAIDTSRWNTSKVDWSIYHDLTEHHFSKFPPVPIYCSMSSSIAQVIVDSVTANLTNTINICASQCANRARPRPPFTYSRHPYQHLFDELSRLSRCARKVQRRVSADIEMGNTSLGAQTRRRTLSQLRFRILAFKVLWNKEARNHRTQQWRSLLARMSSQHQQVRWKIWRRTIPSGQRSLSSVTLNENDHIPKSLKESLNNFASFYSKVMSNDPIPSWGASSSAAHASDSDPGSESFLGLVQDVLGSDIRNFDCALDTPFTIEEVQAAAKYLRKSTAPGHDGIPASFLSKASPAFFRTLTDVFNFSWHHSVFPSEWKRSNAFAIFKKGDRSDPSSYRLICITSVIARLFERVVHTRLSDFLDSNHFFSNNQAGFRRQLSTADNIYRLVRDVYTHLRNGKQLPVIFLDIIKAFDRVPHDLLLFKLHTQAQVSGKAWAWFKAFLSDRQFRVTQNDQSSDWFPTQAGVPQGCVGSPTFFAVYINDLDDKIDSDPDSPDISALSLILSLFADDGSGWPAFKRGRSFLSQYKIIRNLIDRIENWSLRWRLDFSTTKTQILLFFNKYYPRDPSRPISLNSHNIEFVDSYKYLGLTLQSNGRWNRQFDAIITKAKLTANLIARINERNCPPGPLITASLVRYILIPQMAYAIAFWRPSKSHFRVMNQLLAGPLRRALGLHHSASAARTLWEFGIPSFETIRLRCILQAVSRAYRSTFNGNFLPSILVDDIKHPDTASSTAFYCRPFAHELREIQLLYPSSASFPMDTKQINTITKLSMAQHFSASASAKALAMKPTSEQARYLAIDPKPTVCIRARLRLSVALTPRRKHLYSLVGSDKCCGVSGDTAHVIMHCTKFTTARLKCVNDLQRLYTPITLTVNLALGHPPPPPADKSLCCKQFLRELHDKCLLITGVFISAIDAISRL